MDIKNEPLAILIVEDDDDLREALTDTLALGGYKVIATQSGPEALQVLDKQRVGLVVTDVQMQPMDGHTLLAKIKASYPYVPVLLMTAYGKIDKAVEAMRAGACHYLTKPFEPNKLLAEVARYMLSSSPNEEGDMVAFAPQTQVLLDLAQRVASTNATVLITGESGCGKEIIARFIHRNSGRSAKPFVAINCAAIPENLLESTLFGFEKSAFTGATHAQPGKFEQAQEGTLLLDEISEMPLSLQAKLLRVLQEREVERVGGRKMIPLDIRVLATSNRDLPAEVQRGTFREDLYYRLNVFPLHVPPLRERSQDVLPLAEYFLKNRANMLGKQGMYLSSAAQQQLTQYAWPGNIRELENVIQRAMILAPGQEINAEHLHLLSSHSISTSGAAIAAPADSNPASAVSTTPDMKSLERTHIMETLAAVNGSRKLAAQRLGISERTLRYRLQQYREEANPDK